MVPCNARAAARSTALAQGLQIRHAAYSRGASAPSANVCRISCSFLASSTATVTYNTHQTRTRHAPKSQHSDRHVRASHERARAAGRVARIDKTRRYSTAGHSLFLLSHCAALRRASESYSSCQALATMSITPSRELKRAADASCPLRACGSVHLSRCLPEAGLSGELKTLRQQPRRPHRCHCQCHEHKEGSGNERSTQLTSSMASVMGSESAISAKSST